MPAPRLQDRLFWFHLTPKQLDQDTFANLLKKYHGNSEALAALNHDCALHAIVAAVVADLDELGTKLWVEALSSWHKVVSNDDYWALFTAVEARGRFEPAALPSEISTLRDSAVRLAAEPLILATRDAQIRYDSATVRRVLAALNELSNTGSWAELAQDEIVSDALVQFKSQCEEISAECNGKIIRTNEEAKNNKVICDASVKRYREEICPSLDKLLSFFPADHRLAKQAKEEAARSAQALAMCCTWAHDFSTSEKLHEEALKLAPDSVIAIGIKDGLTQVREAKQKLRIFADLKPISGAPWLFTLNGIGFTLYGHSDFDAETQSFIAIYYFTVLFIPIFPIARYRVINEKGNSYRFLGKLPLRSFDRLHLGLAVIAIIGAIVAGNSDALNLPGAKSTSGYRFNSGYNNNNLNSGYRTNSNSSGYSRQSQLSNLKSQIETGRTRHAQLKNQFQPVLDQLTSLNNQMKSLELEIDALDAQKPFRSQLAVQNYNNRVDRYNYLLAQSRQLYEANKAAIETLSDLEDRDTALVNQYNVLLKGNSQ